ncbi:MAG: DHA2 family efflux MFS transporter permease subunit [Gemmatimonadaceae bacterium]|nr:DHA2 family efflux MFS transporter permease subunit [Gemmatimonadaceae bacterium]
MGPARGGRQGRFTLGTVAAEPGRLDHKWLVAASVSIGAMMATIDMSIVNVALPQIRGEVGATIDQMTALATSFAIAQVVVMPLTAFLGRIVGQRRVYLACLWVFIVGSALCGFSRTLPQLVLARTLQGLGAGALMPSQMAILRQTFPRKEQGMAMAVVGMVITFGPAVGPTLGGWIVDNWSWPWIFYINLPIGLLGISMSSRYVHDPEDIRAANAAHAERIKKDFDWAGIVLLSMGLAALQYVLEEGNRNDWFDSPLITALAVVAGGSLIAFLVVELHAKVPSVNIRLFKDPVFTSATLLASVMFSSLMAGMFLLPVFMQELLGFTAFKSGMALLPRALVMMVVTPIVGRIYNHVSPRLLVAIGVSCVSIGCWEMGSFTLQTSQAGIIGVLVLQGIGFSCLFVPLATVALSHVPRTQLTDATGLNAVVRQFGGSAGLAIYGTLLSQHATRARSHLAEHVTAYDAGSVERLAMITRGLVTHGYDTLTAKTAALQAMAGTVARQGAVLAFDHVFALTGLALAVTLPLVLVLRQSEHDDHPDTVAAGRSGTPAATEQNGALRESVTLLE